LTTKVLVVGKMPTAAVVTTLTRRSGGKVVVRSKVKRPGRFEAALGLLKEGRYEARSVLRGKTVKRTTIIIPKGVKNPYL
jgi:hypothetical protein